MESIEALHTFARRRCEEQAEYWRVRYHEIGSRSSLPEGQNLYPRYQVLDAIRIEIERMILGEFSSVGGLLEWLELVAWEAQSDTTRNPWRQAGISRQAMEEERAKFCAALRFFVDKGDWNVVRLPFRRTLQEMEAEDVWKQVRRRWNIVHDGWYPLYQPQSTDPVIAFCADACHNAITVEALQDLFAMHKIERIWELREFAGEPDLELALELFDPRYCLSEGYWTSGDMDWLIYVSHENSITFAGSWLAEAVKVLWPKWKEAEYVPASFGSVR